MSQRLSASIVIAAIMMVGSIAGAVALKPTVHIADLKPKLVVKDVFPTQFADWKEVPGVQQVLPDPVAQAVIDATYSQTLARAYINSKGQVILMSIAYGSDQNSESTAAHRPEFCYVGQGFTITDKGAREVEVGHHKFPVRLLTGVREGYVEQISYYVTLDETATLPGLGRKLAQLNYGLRGKIADGMLVRISTPNVSEAEAVAIHNRFLQDLNQSFPSAFRSRVFGA
ncbi:MAG TPA: EpsI family protein [Aquabacterium sp.]|uniref:exosortase C-terminal domain/associated protein EpsI n=1 Tax=Aquabacterium sp. TaxID=1872578 RepID=UPI002D89B533|nr:exosortase C-terminal domain/associated protein EpsI [Aquabacterium sp.]HET6789196.1 EpsI family protein [Aquabacterium sp.]HEX5373460.1 EpsI family protein [Aquabacterium sp.]